VPIQTPPLGGVMVDDAHYRREYGFKYTGYTIG
jgi:hypothetical protein